MAAGAGALAGCATRAIGRSSDSPWIDLQVNGRVGISFTDRELTEEGVLKVVEVTGQQGEVVILPVDAGRVNHLAQYAQRLAEFLLIALVT